MAATYLKNFDDDEIRSAFRLFDQDGSGYIQANELENIMNQMGKRYSKADINAMIKNFDSSGDGKISYEEFVKMFN
jgi:calmodulin